MVDVVLVVASGRNRVIGAAGGLPWRLRSDLKRFKAITWGKPVIMGRKTYRSIGKPLAGRDNIIVTRDPDFPSQGVRVMSSLDAALCMGKALADARGAGEVCVIGGAEIYAQSLPHATRIDLTEVDAAPDGDALFPELDPAVWTETSRQAPVRADGDDHRYSLVTLSRNI
jgi:dihydrofolate reductase